MFTRLLERIALALDKAGFPYMVIGGQAVLLYGEPRLTRDIDVTLGVGLEGLAQVLLLVRKARLQPLVDPETFTRQTMVLPCEDQKTGVRVDFVFSFSPYEQQALKRVRAVKMGKAQVRFASVEDVVIHKVVAGRPRDMEDIRSILVKNPGIDLAYTRHWLHEFSVAVSVPFLERFNQALEDTQ